MRNIIYLFLLLSSQGYGEDIKKKECKNGYELNNDNQCVTHKSENCIHSGYCYGCGYGYKYRGGKYKHIHSCEYSHRSDCKGIKTITVEEGGKKLNTSQCR